MVWMPPHWRVRLAQAVALRQPSVAGSGSASGSLPGPGPGPFKGSGMAHRCGAWLVFRLAELSKSVHRKRQFSLAQRR